MGKKTDVHNFCRRKLLEIFVELLKSTTNLRPFSLHQLVMDEQEELLFADYMANCCFQARHTHPGPEMTSRSTCKWLLMQNINAASVPDTEVDCFENMWLPAVSSFSLASGICMDYNSCIMLNSTKAWKRLWWKGRPRQVLIYDNSFGSVRP